MRPTLPLAFAVAAVSSIAGAQTYTTADPIVRKIFDEGMLQSQAGRLIQTLSDSIGPRLTGTPGMKRGNDWLVSMYTSWGVEAKNEQYGTWKAWRRGITHIDLIAPRVRSLEGMMLAWSGGTGGKDVEGDVVILPDVPDSAAFAAWLPSARGRFVLISMLQPTCRPDDNWERYALPESFAGMRAQRDTATRGWTQRIQRTGLGTGLGTGALGVRLEAAGVAGVVASRWSNGWGVQKVFDAQTTRVPSVDISCEDYGLLYRLAENNQGPKVRIRADAEFMGEQPVFNTIARIPGTTKPDEFVMLSAHFDSWDGGSGTTDNGTGTITMLEAARILRKHYPSPKRTIIVGHWSGEEQGLNGSRGFAADHPEVVRGLQALFNQDNGTGRVINFSASGLTTASGNLATWMANVPAEISRHITMSFPGAPSGGGSDNASFICYGAPAFGLGALDWSYGTYTWHTQRDTYDKVVLDDLKNNATLTAMLVYLASEDPETLSRDRRVFERGPAPRPAGQGGFGQATAWPACRDAIRESKGYVR
ncbi:MAG: M20/M25/M40 family metallo-hydrolase [Gemmatimonadaceae bacterium]